ncbi:hypothetical protein E1B28_002311 [Marasmius oreades]|uniref:DUF6593 domain-containing protein n=1 Tax=Marasmius oreades TaxID=181124 RepID=A0A9P7RNE1_9AGAR|nr:uncharacterized protein E1B28_002311 [Marasmius oreades]KAG7086350.1 hypothetical protein E1B28_002311 [Marasmius oreades]
MKNETIDVQRNLGLVNVHSALAAHLPIDAIHVFKTPPFSAHSCHGSSTTTMKLYQTTSWAWNAMTNNTYYDDHTHNHIVYKVHTPFKFSNRTTTITKTRESEHEHVLPPLNQPQPAHAGSAYEPGGESYNLVELHTDSSGLKRRKSEVGSLTASIDVDRKSVDVDDVDVDDHQTLVNGESGVATSSSTSLGVGPSSSSGSPRIFEYLAQIDWRLFSSSKFRLGDGQEIEAKAFFRKQGWGPYGRHRVFTAKDGREYKWYLRYWHSELALNNEEKTPVAKFNRRSIHKSLFGKPSSGSAYLEIFPAGEHMVDEIFVTFIYIEKLRKEKERAARPKGGGGP